MRMIIPMALATLLAASPAAAGSGCHDAETVVRHIFEEADQDQDGALSRAEYDEAGLPEYGVSFEESDLDADGVTSIAEYVEIYERHHPTGDRSEI